MTPEELQQFNELKQEVETLKQLYYKDSYSDLEVFIKKVIFKSNVTLGSSIGITPDKLGFYGIAPTPIVQPTTAITGATFVVGAGTAVNDASTFDGYTLKQVVKALRNLGLIL